MVGLLIAASAAAQGGGIVEIPLGTVLRTDPGIETTLASMPVPPEFVGEECEVESRAENNSSVHPGNDLVVASDGAAVVLVDVEGAAGKVTTAAQTVVLGDAVTVTLVMGPDGVFSAGATAGVVLRCIDPTSTSSTSTSTSAPPSTESTVPPTSPTVLPETTINNPPSSVPPPTPPELAVTGPDRTLWLLIAGLVLVDIGYLVATLRRPGPGDRIGA